MEEKRVKISQKESDYLVGEIQNILADYLHGGESDEVIAKFEELLDIYIEEKEIALLPFNLQEAKEGKPVCTRDGRKARIICFDAKFPKTGNIVALVKKENGEEVIQYYYYDGHCSIGRSYDLMMLPKKKEGWVNVYKERCHESKEEAISCRACDMECIDTIRVEWEE